VILFVDAKHLDQRKLQIQMNHILMMMIEDEDIVVYPRMFLLSNII